MGEQVKNLIENYQEYLNLNYVSSRNDPEEEPYISKYLARAVLIKQIEAVNALNESEIPNETCLETNEFAKSNEISHLIRTYEHFLNKLDAKCLKKFNKKSKVFLITKLFEFNIGKNYVETEEIESGERIFSKIVQELEALTEGEPEDYYNPILFNLKMSSSLELVFVWSSRGDYKKCHSLLTSIEEMYHIYKNSSIKNFIAENSDKPAENEQAYTTMPFDPSELIRLSLELTNESRKINIESLYTYSLFYSAQIYGKLDEKVKSAHYCQLTLQRQIDEHDEGTRKNEEKEQDPKAKKHFEQQPLEKIRFDPLDWATHAGALSQYYVCEGDFATARHCLVCADAILNKLNKERVNSEDTADYEKLKEQTQSIRRCWGKYSIELLKFAKQMLVESTDEPGTLSLHAQQDKPSRFHFNLPTSLYDVKSVELSAITSNIPFDYEQARSIFLKAQTILNEVKGFFVLDGYVSDHSEIIRDISELYNRLIFFDSDADRRCKMHKRRLDLLIPLCDSISEQYYLTLKRQYLFDIGTIYSDMVDLKIEILSEKQDKFKENPQLYPFSPKESASAVTKINQLAKNSILRFEAFLTTMKVQPEKLLLPEKFDDHNVRPALLAKFYLGRLYSKIISTDAKIRLENCRITLECYSYLVKYCDDHREDNSKEAIDSMEIEYKVCKEMCAFLPGKLDKLSATMK